MREPVLLDEAYFSRFNIIVMFDGIVLKTNAEFLVKYILFHFLSHMGMF